MTRAATLGMFLWAAALAAAAPVPEEDDATRIARIYGTRADPKDDATYKMLGETLVVRSPARELPPREGFDEVPTPEQRAVRVWKPTPAAGSRLWREVAGDFTATVRVSFPLRPAPVPSRESPPWLPRAAGLVAWSGDKDHVGMIRHESVTRGAVPGTLRVREGFQTIWTHSQGVRLSSGVASSDEDAAYLMLQRVGTRLTGAHGRDGKEWTEFLADEVGWKGTVKVGVYVAHFSDAPFLVTFDEYKLTIHAK